MNIPAENKRHCFLCGPETPYKILYPERLPLAEYSFAARRNPARIHFRIVKCNGCGLTFSNLIYSRETISQLYKDSEFIGEKQIENINRDYGLQFKKNLSVIKEKNSLLDVGCSSGFFLKTAMDLGFLDVRGVEPGKASVDEAEQFIRDRIKNEMFSSKLYPPESFDVVSAFQVFDHVLNPKEFLQDIKSVLKKDGVLFAINHNIESYMPVLMGEHSPMYDIEHIYLFNKNTMRKLLEQNGFKIIKIENIPNTYVLEYCLKMFPMPRFLKKTLVAITNKMKLNNVQIRIPAGNMVTIAKKQ